MVTQTEPTLWEQAEPEVRRLKERNSPVYALLVRLSTRLNLREQEIEIMKREYRNLPKGPTEEKRPRGRPAQTAPEPIPDTPENIIETVMRTRSKAERDRILKKSGD